MIADAATGVALALRGEGDPYALSGILRQEDALTPAAVRVLGADALAPYAVEHRAVSVGADDEAVVRQALAAYPPGADASAVSGSSSGRWRPEDDGGGRPADRLSPRPFT
ncbi:hypothetical protein ABT380_37115, partial [Streptomyces lydicus]